MVSSRAGCRKEPLADDRWSSEESLLLLLCNNSSGTATSRATKSMREKDDSVQSSGYHSSNEEDIRKVGFADNRTFLNSFPPNSSTSSSSSSSSSSADGGGKVATADNDRTGQRSREIVDFQRNHRAIIDQPSPARRHVSPYHKDCLIPKNQPEDLRSDFGTAGIAVCGGGKHQSDGESSKEFFEKIKIRLKSLTDSSRTIIARNYAKKIKANDGAGNAKSTMAEKPMFISTVKTGIFLEPPPEIAALLGMAKSQPTSPPEKLSHHAPKLYSFSSRPRILKSGTQLKSPPMNGEHRAINRRKRNAPKLSDDTVRPIPSYGNIMFDRRVARGSNFNSNQQSSNAPKWNNYFGNAKLLSAQEIENNPQRQAEANRRMQVRQRAQQRIRKIKQRTPPPVEGRKHLHIQTENNIMNELTATERSSDVIKVDAETQVSEEELPKEIDAELDTSVINMARKIIQEATMEIAKTLRRPGSNQKPISSDYDNDNIKTEQVIITAEQLAALVTRAIENIKLSSDSNVRQVDEYLENIPNLQDKTFNEIQKTVTDLEFITGIVRRTINLDNSDEYKTGRSNSLEKIEEEFTENDANSKLFNIADVDSSFKELEETENDFTNNEQAISEMIENENDNVNENDVSLQSPENEMNAKTETNDQNATDDVESNTCEISPEQEQEMEREATGNEETGNNDLNDESDNDQPYEEVKKEENEDEMEQRMNADEDDNRSMSSAKSQRGAENLNAAQGEMDTPAINSVRMNELKREKSDNSDEINYNSDSTQEQEYDTEIEVTSDKESKENPIDSEERSESRIQSSTSRFEEDIEVRSNREASENELENEKTNEDDTEDDDVIGQYDAVAPDNAEQQGESGHLLEEIRNEEIKQSDDLFDEEEAFGREVGERQEITMQEKSEQQTRSDMDNERELSAERERGNTEIEVTSDKESKESIIDVEERSESRIQSSTSRFEEDAEVRSKREASENELENEKTNEDDDDVIDQYNAIAPDNAELEKNRNEEIKQSDDQFDEEQVFGREVEEQQEITMQEESEPQTRNNVDNERERSAEREQGNSSTSGEERYEETKIDLEETDGRGPVQEEEENVEKENQEQEINDENGSPREIKGNYDDEVNLKENENITFTEAEEKRADGFVEKQDNGQDDENNQEIARNKDEDFTEENKEVKQSDDFTDEPPNDNDWDHEKNREVVQSENEETVEGNEENMETKQPNNFFHRRDENNLDDGSNGEISQNTNDETVEEKEEENKEIDQSDDFLEKQDNEMNLETMEKRNEETVQDEINQVNQPDNDDDIQNDENNLDDENKREILQEDEIGDEDKENSMKQSDDERNNDRNSENSREINEIEEETEQETDIAQLDNSRNEKDNDSGKNELPPDDANSQEQNIEQNESNVGSFENPENQQLVKQLDDYLESENDNQNIESFRPESANISLDNGTNNLVDDSNETDERKNNNAATEDERNMMVEKTNNDSMQQVTESAVTYQPQSAEPNIDYDQSEFDNEKQNDNLANEESGLEEIKTVSNEQLVEPLSDYQPANNQSDYDSNMEQKKNEKNSANRQLSESTEQHAFGTEDDTNDAEQYVALSGAMNSDNEAKADVINATENTEEELTAKMNDQKVVLMSENFAKAAHLSESFIQTERYNLNYERVTKETTDEKLQLHLNFDKEIEITNEKLQSGTGEYNDATLNNDAELQSGENEYATTNLNNDVELQSGTEEYNDTNLNNDAELQPGMEEYNDNLSNDVELQSGTEEYNDNLNNDVELQSGTEEYNDNLNNDVELQSGTEEYNDTNLNNDAELQSGMEENTDTNLNNDAELQSGMEENTDTNLNNDTELQTEMDEYSGTNVNNGVELQSTTEEYNGTNLNHVIEQTDFKVFKVNDDNDDNDSIIMANDGTSVEDEISRRSSLESYQNIIINEIIDTENTQLADVSNGNGLGEDKIKNEMNTEYQESGNEINRNHDSVRQHSKISEHVNYVKLNINNRSVDDMSDQINASKSLSLPTNLNRSKSAVQNSSNRAPFFGNNTNFFAANNGTATSEIKTANNQLNGNVSDDDDAIVIISNTNKMTNNDELSNNNNPDEDNAFVIKINHTDSY